MESSGDYIFYVSLVETLQIDYSPVGNPSFLKKNMLQSYFESKYTSISNLDPYLAKWTIRGRCSSKTEIKNWNNAKGTGQLFSATFLDETSEIRATAFQEAVDKLYPLIQVGSIYVISGAQVKFANKKFTSIKHNYELTLDSNTNVTMEEENDNQTIPNTHYNFVEIDNIQDLKAEELVDVIGIVHQIKQVVPFKTKKGEESYRRSVLIVDTSQRTIELTVWGDAALSIDQITVDEPHPVLAVKCVRVSDFGGRSLSSTLSTEYELNPTVPESLKLKQWYHSLESQTFSSLSSERTVGHSKEVTLSAIKSSSLGLGSSEPNTEKADFVNVRNFTINFIKKDGTLWYKACSNTDCKFKKVYEEGGNWKCPVCNGVNNFKHRWVLNLSIIDHTALEYVSAFADDATLIMGYEADQVVIIKDTDQELFEKIFEQALYKQYSATLKMKNEIYQDIPKLKISILNIIPIDYELNTKNLINQIQELESI